MSREKEADEALEYINKTDRYRDIIRTAITYATSHDNTVVYTRQYDFKTISATTGYKYETTSNYVDKYLIENKLIDAMLEIEKTQELEIAKMKAKIEAYELALTGGLRPNLGVEMNKSNERKKK